MNYLEILCRLNTHYTWRNSNHGQFLLRLQRPLDIHFQGKNYIWIVYIYNLKLLQKKQSQVQNKASYFHFLFFLVLGQDFSYLLKKAMAQQWSFKNNEPFIHRKPNRTASPSPELQSSHLLHEPQWSLVGIALGQLGANQKRSMCFRPGLASEELCDLGQVGQLGVELSAV